MGDRLATIEMGRKVGGGGLLCQCVPFGGAGSPSNTMWPGPRPTSIVRTKWHPNPSNRLPTIHQLYRTDRHTGQDRQTTVRWHRANRFTDGRPETADRSTLSSHALSVMMFVIAKEFHKSSILKQLFHNGYTPTPILTAMKLSYFSP